MGNLYKTLKSQGLDPDESFEECAKLQMEKLKKAFLMPQSRPMGIACHGRRSDGGVVQNPAAISGEEPGDYVIMMCYGACVRDG